MLNSEMYNLFIVSYASSDATLGRSRAQQPTALSHSLPTSAATAFALLLLLLLLVALLLVACHGRAAPGNQHW